ncbi:AIPR family protein [Bradyrhizobium sp. 170]|uniref:AIPR family protein n=1 Tax=Bradyrhizobium sp. 170 TaxID=2782641 RepID=UPI001FFEE0DD|nr:AIPR family protein [Bradyrhizobium sp. 170]UPK03065.1 AIPR family protein [Bradyrhizobium sp. 170]
MFVQAKRSSSFDGAALGSFGYGVGEFFNPNTKEPRNERILEAVHVMQRIYSSSGKFKRGNPLCRLYYVTTGKVQGDASLGNRIDKVTAELESLEYFDDVEVSLIGASELRKLYSLSKNSISREFMFSSRQDIPEIPGVKEAFVGFIPAKQYLPLICESGKIIRSIFYDNVRDWQGYNDVNKEISETLKSDRKRRFVLMNNGVTIIARNMTHTSSKFVIEDFQVVNGCQTSHVLFDRQDDLDDSVLVPLRLIWTQEEDVIEDIIHATNKQTEVTSEQFFALTDFARELEEFFKTFPDAKKLYYERRSRQYDGLPIEKTRVVVQANAVRAFAGMFLGEPHNTVRRGKALSERVGQDIFIKDHRLFPYYTSAYALYALEFLFRNQKIDPKYKIARFQILFALRLLANTDPLPQLNAHKMDSYCQKICEHLWDQAKAEDIFTYVCEAMDTVAGAKLDRDTVHTTSFTEALAKHCVKQKS